MNIPPSPEKVTTSEVVGRVLDHQTRLQISRRGDMETGASGAALVETMFSYPGIGNRLGGAIAALDYPVIYGIVFFLVVGIAVATLLVDLLYPFLDPRISYSGG